MIGTLPSEKVKVLDLGFVQLVEVMGGDAGVVDAARVCYDSKGEPEKDRRLVRYLMEHEHMTPFEHAVLKFHIKAPLFVARQWFRHRSSSYNEASQRYAEVKDEFYTPAVWRAQDTKNKQGSVGRAEFQGIPSSILANHNSESMKRYKLLLDNGVAREMARMVLPVNVYTEWYWTVNARNLMAFIKLRSESHAQWEIRQYSNTIWPFLARAMPWTAEAFIQTLPQSRYTAVDGVAGPNIVDVLPQAKIIPGVPL